MVFLSAPKSTLCCTPISISFLLNGLVLQTTITFPPAGYIWSLLDVEDKLETD